MYRRALFFLVCGIICGSLVYPTPENIRWFTAMLAALYLVLAAASWLDSWSRNRQGGG
jgi:hypothetical protein